MSNRNLVDFREWRAPRFEPRKENFANARETLALLQAFTSIECPLVRGEIIKTAQKAAFPDGLPPPENAA
jgi:uncharacterized ubiquitin-like protein YukD